MDKLNPEEQRLIEIIRGNGWGSVKEIQFQDGKPTVVKLTSTIKLK